MKQTMTREQALAEAQQIYRKQPSESLVAARDKAAFGFLYRIYLLRNDRSEHLLGSGLSWEQALAMCKITAATDGKAL